MQADNVTQIIEKMKSLSQLTTIELSKIELEEVEQLSKALKEDTHPLEENKEKKRNSQISRSSSRKRSSSLKSKDKYDNPEKAKKE